MLNKRPLLYLVGMLLSSVGLVLLAQRDTVEQADNEAKCDMYSMDCSSKGKDCCGIWNNGVCMRGKSDGYFCKENKMLGVGILVLFVLWVVFLLLFVASLFSCYSKDKKSKRSRRR